MNKNLLWAVLAFSMVFGQPDAAKTQEYSWVKENYKTEVTDILLQENTFLWVNYKNLTHNQKKLFDKLTPEERKDLSENVSIKPWQIDFLNLGLAIASKDIEYKPMLKKEADVIISELGDWWRLPDDVAFIKNNDGRIRFELSNQSDYDEMIWQLPWPNDGQKIANFLLLTDMNAVYWTRATDIGELRGDEVEVFITRTFSEDGWSLRMHGWIFNQHFLRPIKDI